MVAASGAVSVEWITTGAGYFPPVLVLSWWDQDCQGGTSPGEASSGYDTKPLPVYCLTLHPESESSPHDILLSLSDYPALSLKKPTFSITAYKISYMVLMAPDDLLLPHLWGPLHYWTTKSQSRSCPQATSSISQGCPGVLFLL